MAGMLLHPVTRPCDDLWIALPRRIAHDWHQGSELEPAAFALAQARRQRLGPWWVTQQQVEEKAVVAGLRIGCRKQFATCLQAAYARYGLARGKFCARPQGKVVRCYGRRLRLWQRAQHDERSHRIVAPERDLRLGA